MTTRYEKLGFKKVHSVPKHSAPADLLRHLKRQRGIYMLVFGGREHYFGRSDAVCTRLARHQHRYGVVKVAFFSHPAATLHAKERETIERAVDMGMIVRNKIHNRLHSKAVHSSVRVVLAPAAAWPFPTRAASRRKN